MPVYYVNQQAYGVPLSGFRKGLGVDVCTLPVGHLVDQVYARLCEALVHKSNTHTVCASNVSHCWISTCLTDAYHGLVILVKFEADLSFEQYVPELQSRKARRS